MEEEGVKVKPRVRRYEEVPAPDLFSSQIEPLNAPSVFVGCVSGWTACTRWDPSQGGLDYLLERVGSSPVEAMLSESAPVFCGDLRSHERVSLPFSTFITSCKLLLAKETDFHFEESISKDLNLKRSVSTTSREPYVYLAQVPICNFDKGKRCSLESLMEDIEKPSLIEAKSLASINFWMNSDQCRSSTHYDPHHNLLCVVAGSKQVVLWPPSASGMLYPLPIHGEASNHSAVDVSKPNFMLHTRAKLAKDYSQTVLLHAGDALFIPEGWYHQVDSENMTIAVNFWWQSEIMLKMLDHMDAYYLRRILRRLIDKQMDKMLSLDSKDNEDLCNTNAFQLPRNDGHGEFLEQLEPFALQALYQLVSVVHESVRGAGHYNETTVPANMEGSTGRRLLTTNPSNDDLVAKIFFSLKPKNLRTVLLAMAHYFPRTLEALVIHVLTPAAAEVLTQKFDKMDQENAKDDQSQFYQKFYSVFDDQFSAMDAILNGKEQFAFEALKNVLEEYVGVKCDRLS